MPEGLKYLLAAPGRQKSLVILADEKPSLFIEDFIQELLTNFMTESCSEQGKKYHIHLVAVAYNAQKYNVKRKDLVTFYNLIEEPDTNLDKLYCNLLDHLKKTPSPIVNILIVDDFFLLSLLTSFMDYKKLRQFLRKISQDFDKIFIFAHQETINPSETAILYDVASAIGVLSSFYGTLDSPHKFFVCDMLKIKPERRVSHEQSKFQVVKGEVVEYSNIEVGKIQGRNQEEMLKNLTTFKLTLEDNEKESRSKLYLPYFDAQKTTVEDPEMFDDYDDEEDEEV